VIIPVLNDTDALTALLGRLRAQQPGPLEVIVVDGAAHANVAGVCAAAGARYMTAPSGRGRQLRAGAAQARGNVLWFLHADALVPANAIAVIQDAVAQGAQAGYFQFRFSGARTWTKRVIEIFVAWRCRVATVYGDQGLFAQREVYERTPGFAATSLFEEVPLVRALRRAGRFTALAAAIEVDCRRWERRGFWRQTLINRLLALGYALGFSPERLARWYRGRG
jgi:rSAM/selenodomain-associated transferase 2